MTMTPEDFRRHFEAAIVGEPRLEPATAGAAVDRGDRTLRRRRVAAVVLSVAMVIGLGTAIDLVRRNDPQQEPAPAPSSTPTPSADEALIRLCRAVADPQRPMSRRFFASGTPVVRAVSGSAEQRSAALESADGRWWAWCLLTEQGPSDYWTGMQFYTRSGIGDGGLSGQIVSDLTCGYDRGEPRPCSTFAFRWARQLAPRVASIEFVMADGERLEFDTTNGYIAVDYSGRLAAPVRGEDAVSFWAYRSVVYRNAGGQVIAAEPKQGDLPYPQRIHTRGREVW